MTAATANTWATEMLSVTPFHRLDANGTPLCGAAPLRRIDDTDPNPPAEYRCRYCCTVLAREVPA